MISKIISPDNIAEHLQNIIYKAQTTRFTHKIYDQLKTHNELSGFSSLSGLI